MTQVGPKIVDSAVAQKLRQLKANPPRGKHFKADVQANSDRLRQLAEDPSRIDPCLQASDLHRMLPHLALRPRSTRPAWVEERVKQITVEYK